MSRERALATAFRLLDLGFFRIGGETYAEQNGSYGLATISKDHVRIEDGSVVFEYTAKSGKERYVALAEEEVLDSVTALKRRRSGSEKLLAFQRRLALARHQQRRHQRVRQDRGVRGGVGQGLPHLARHRAGRRRARRLHPRRRQRAQAPSRRRAGDEGGLGVPRQHPGGVPRVLRRPARGRPVRGRRHDRARAQAPRREHPAGLPRHPRADREGDAQPAEEGTEVVRTRAKRR